MSGEAQPGQVPLLPLTQVMKGDASKAGVPFRGKRCGHHIIAGDGRVGGCAAVCGVAGVRLYRLYTALYRLYSIPRVGRTSHCSQFLLQRSGG